MNWEPDSYDRNTRFVSELGMPVVELLQPASPAQLWIHSTGPSMAMVLFQIRRVIGHWPTISTVTG